MSHRSDLTSALAAICVTFVAILTAPATSLAGPATDEYKLDLPAVERASLGNISSGPGSGTSLEAGGVVAESAGSESPLEAIGSAVSSVPLAIAAILLVGPIGLVLLRARGREKPA